MSMLSSQRNRLIFLANELESRHFNMNEYANAMRRAADTIWELRNKLAGTVDQSEEIERLKVENTKLRKLAHGLNWCTENAKMPSAECEYCPLGDAGYGELSCERLMRELGIEAE